MGGGPYYAALGGSRILNTSRADQSGSDNADVTGWTKTSPIIVAVRIHSNSKETEAAQYKLRWRDETDSPGGAFGDLDSTGECKFGATTALVNGTNLIEGNSRCDSQGDTWQNGEEVEGTKLSDSIDLADEYESELQFAVSLADGDDSHKYTFDLYDSTRSAQVGVLGAQITLEAGAQTYYQNTGQGATAIVGTLSRLSTFYRAVGGYVMTIFQVLSKKSFKDVGDYAMLIEGILATATIFLQAVGGYAMTIVGSLIKQISKFPGGHGMIIAGSLIKKTSKDMGGYAMSIVGILSTATIYLQNTGEYAMTIAGSLVKKTSVFMGSYLMTITQTLSKKGFKDTGGHAMTITGILSAGKVVFQAVGGYAMVITDSLIKKTSKYFGNHAMTIIGNCVPNKLGEAVTSVIKKLMSLGVGR